MVNARKKGNKAEREAETLYHRVGFETTRATGTRWGEETDFFNDYDIMAVRPGRRVRFAQVKSNRAEGVRETFDRATALLPLKHATPDYLVRHDGAGGRPVAWRLLRPHTADGSVTYRTVVDERKDGTPASGDGVVEYLRRNA